MGQLTGQNYFDQMPTVLCWETHYLSISYDIKTMSYSRKPNGTSVTRYIFKKYLIVLINANCKIHRHRTAFHRPRTKSFRKHRRHEGNGNSALKARQRQSALPSHSNTTTLFLLQHNEHKHVYPHSASLPRMFSPSYPSQGSLPP